VELKIIYRVLGLLSLMLWALAPRPAFSQTPSPLEEWQYSGGIILARLFQPNLPDWRYIGGVAAEVQPVFDGARADKVQGGPVINIQYKDLAFLSTGEGLGVNILRGPYYRVGVALAYDFGRKERDDYSDLAGMGNIQPAPVAKVFASYVLSKTFPLVLRVDARELLGGADGAVADIGFYMPLPGSSKKFVMFAGPSVSFADHHFLQSEYGVSAAQSLTSGHPEFEAHSGIESLGFGLSATRFITNHWLLNFDGALTKLKGSADISPITERTMQSELALSVEYLWQ
jgi:outer membrane scaffolding protein for murein synthesis (MipA/OmpV family)